MSRKYKITDDLSGISQLSTEAVYGLTAIIEAIHTTIFRLGFVDRNKTLRKRGISGFVYRVVRLVTVLSGTSLNYLFRKLQNYVAEQESSHKREMLISILNGVLGDFLNEQKNPLTIAMQFRINGHTIDEKILAQKLNSSGNKLLLVIHGHCMNDLQWTRSGGYNHAELLAEETGMVPVFLHYNSGKHISENGREFSEQLEALLQKLPDPDVYILAHSMGGLVSRSAFHYAEYESHTWLQRLKKIVFLGTPHHGSLLERAGNMIDLILDSNRFTSPISKLGKIRSAGITDMRYGYVIDEHWNDKDRFASSADNRIPVPLPEHVDCYAIAAAKSKKSGLIGDRVTGDGLVNIDSALGKHKKSELTLEFPPQHTEVFYGIGHMKLLSDEKVYGKIREWLGDD